MSAQDHPVYQTHDNPLSNQIPLLDLLVRVGFEFAGYACNDDGSVERVAYHHQLNDQYFIVASFSDPHGCARNWSYNERQQLSLTSNTVSPVDEKAFANWVNDTTLGMLLRRHKLTTLLHEIA